MATFSFLRHLRKYYDFFFNKKENSHSCCICMNAVIYTNTQHTSRILLNTLKNTQNFSEFTEKFY